MQWKFLYNRSFWHWACGAALVCSLFFLWELGMIPRIPGPPRPAPTTAEILFSIFLIALLSLNVGLLHWRKNTGGCPIGAKGATGIGGTLGALALLCPVCLLLPFSLFGLSLSLAFLSPFLPLLRIIATVLLVASTVMLWPKNTMRT
ncbi:hypothetical protein COV83_00755 [Candidatus Peregrinibacteria bacterium CG11_big_fil_rev_8_21_14_0_20_49_14]|nr:MAG: hypothetical protein COV83_00755 [Candidatus Peregrinibacteria bacterium CG11_big_fil_rev_8_21_14_0_20_49_14]